ncbi:MAG: CusA/CzcA family heavy metal efflux RND transporter, partial [Bacteroidetes bacterium]|nr:CusA/CzcA family heavy metal efflux RND transporter [Bacteroidota bacterium]
QIKLPPGYFITYGGAFENLEEAKKRLLIAVPVALILIFLLLYFAFHSVKEGLLIYSAIPLSAIGGIFALAIRGMPFSISAGVGFIALFGVSVLNGIVLIADFKRLKKEGITDLKEIVKLGTSERLRPVLMTATVASLGFLPMALSNGAGAEVQRPLATVVIGGLLVATLLTLFVLPVLYIIFEKGIIMRKSKIVKPLVLTIPALIYLQAASGQTTIELQGAIDTALKNNLSLKSEQLNAEYLQKIKTTAWSLPQTNAIIDYGQINSAYNDNKFGIAQSMKFPTVYSRQKNVYDEEWKSGLLNVAVRENELRKQVTLVYYQLLYLQQKKKLLQHTDSLFTDFLNMSKLRLKAGEANILEATTAETQQGQVAVQLRELNEDFKTLQLRLKWLLNSNIDFAPADIPFKMSLPLIDDSASLNQHPYILQLEQQQQVSSAKLALEKSKLSPDLLLGFNSMTIRGAGADGITYSGSKRFNSVQAGIGIPLFTRGQRAAIQAGKANLALVQNEYAQGLQLMQSNYRQALQQYEKNLQTVSYYEATALKSADKIIQTANLQFKNGEINYLDWVLLAGNATSIHNGYIEAIRNLNQSIIEINSFTSK